MDFGHGSFSTLNFTGCLGITGCDRLGTRRFDLSVENGDLIFTQKVNFVHPFAHFPGVKDGNARLDLNDNEQFTVSRNVLELKMRIPLDQVVEPGKMPEVHIMSITQRIEDQEPNVYTHHKG
ncbi:MAG: hypothetical protein MJ249_13675 [Kiritimatiellae bacterium]|nr:hypothetical protein [Kiritimatiellia bacterium]